MHYFIFFVVFSFAVVAMGSQDLFTSQESWDDLPLLPSFEMSSDSTNPFLDANLSNDDENDDDDLFGDSINPTDLLSFSASGTDEGGLFLNDFELEASCPSTSEQQTSKNKLRTRRDEVCAPQDQPSLDGLIDMLGIFGDPAQREEELERAAAASSEKIDDQYPCIPTLPNHLCCEGQGEHLATAVFLTRRAVYLTMFNCEPGK